MSYKEPKDKDISTNRDLKNKAFSEAESANTIKEAKQEEKNDKAVTDSRTSFWEFIYSIVSTIVIVAIIVIPIRLFVGKPFLVNGKSMDPSFETWDYLLIDVFTYKFLHEPERGDVIVFKAPVSKGKYFIKRIIGLPGEIVEIKDGKVIIYNKDYKEGFELKEPYVSEKNISHNNLKLSLKEDEYFVMGDNRAGSYDSRFWGALSRDKIVGRAFLRLYPFSEISLFPAAYEFKK